MRSRLQGLFWAASRLATLLLVLPLLVLVPMPVLETGTQAAAAAPGLCLGPVCGDEITRSAKHSWQLRLRLTDQLGHRERVTVDCRDGRISPPIGLVERAYG
ncbi:MAG: hypothetical protein ACK5FE_16495, partial [Cyanobacteriota bacterium]